MTQSQIPLDVRRKRAKLLAGSLADNDIPRTRYRIACCPISDTKGLQLLQDVKTAQQRALEHFTSVIDPKRG